MNWSDDISETPVDQSLLWFPAVCAAFSRMQSQSPGNIQGLCNPVHHSFWITPTQVLSSIALAAECR